MEKLNKIKTNIPSSQKPPIKKIKKNIGFDRVTKTNLYLNDLNYYFKNSIKMNKRRQKELEDLKLKKLSFQEEFDVPKMIYCNSLLNTLVDKEIKEAKNANTNSPIPKRKKQVIEKNKTKSIEKAILEKYNKEKEKIHAKKTLMLFDEFIKSVDNIHLYRTSNDPEKKYEIFNFDDYKQQYLKNNLSNDINNNQSTNKQQLTARSEVSTQIYNQILSENKKKK